MADKRSQALTWTELRVGSVVLLSLLILAGTVLYIGSGGGSPLAGRYQVRALMADVNGLKTGAPVRLGGVEVGAVSRVEFAGEGGMVEVTLSLDRRVRQRVTTHSTASLGSLGLLGEKAVDITSVAGGTPIEDGGFLSAAAEDPFKGLLADSSDSIAHLRRILSRMDAGEGLLGKALRDDELYNRMADVAERLQRVMSKLEAQQGPLGRLVNDEAMAQRLATSVEAIATAAGRVERGEGALGALSRDPELAANLKSATSRLDEVAGRLERGEGTAGKLLTDQKLYDRLDATTARLDTLLGRLERAEGTAGKLIRDPEAYDNLNASLKDVRELVADIRKDPRKYLRVKLSLF
jgi:phospholipid/cholesterol/gamma-HCH transport system substrate-binding protein